MCFSRGKTTQCFHCMRGVVKNTKKTEDTMTHTDKMESYKDAVLIKRNHIRMQRATMTLGNLTE